MSKGRPKLTLRHLNQADITSEESTALFQAFKDDDQPITTAIIGAEMVEHELDMLIHQRLRIKDKKVWRTLVDDIGPLSTFHRKILIGSAMRIFDEKIRHDLALIKNIRNVFAHNRKLISFDHPLIAEELRSSKLLSKRIKKLFLKRAEDEPAQQLLYAILCLRLTLRLMKRRHPRRTRKGLFGTPPSRLAELLSSGPHAPQSHSGGPNPPARLGLLAGLAGLQFPEEGKK